MTYDEREQRTRDYYAAVHTDRLLNSATAVMRKADRELFEAWEAGHKTRWRRGPDNCQCCAYSAGECACGEYGTGELLSLADNPYPRPDVTS